MKTISFSNLKLMKVPDIKSGQCLQITAYGEVLGYFIINPEQVMKDRVEGICSLIDSSRGFK